MAAQSFDRRETVRGEGRCWELYVPRPPPTRAGERLRAKSPGGNPHVLQHDGARVDPDQETESGLVGIHEKRLDSAKVP